MLSTLQGQKDYERFVPDINVKKSLEYNFYARPALEWTCSKAQLKEAVEQMRDIDLGDLKSGEDLLKTAMIIGAVYLGLVIPPTVIIFCCVVKCR